MKTLSNIKNTKNVTVLTNCETIKGGCSSCDKRKPNPIGGTSGSNLTSSNNTSDPNNTWGSNSWGSNNWGGNGGW